MQLPRACNFHTAFTEGKMIAGNAWAIIAGNAWAVSKAAVLCTFIFKHLQAVAVCGEGFEPILRGGGGGGGGLDKKGT